MLINYKYRIYPSVEQIKYFNKCFGARRFTWNFYVSCLETKEFLKTKELKEIFPFLYETDSTIVTNTYMDFLKSIKRIKEKLSSSIKMKSKKENKQSFTSKSNSNSIKIINGKLKINKLKSLIKIKLHRKLPRNGVIKRATIIKTKTDKYFVTLCIKIAQSEKETLNVIKEDEILALDYSSPLFYVDDKGNSPFLRKPFKEYEKKITKIDFQLSKKVLHSKKYNKLLKRKNKIYEHIENIRIDQERKLVHAIAKQFKVVVLEDLSAKEISSRKSIYKLGKAINENSWYRFTKFLEEKIPLVIKIEKYFPSSQICSNCGTQNKEMKDISKRVFVCPSCGHEENRDLNASKNILKRGKEILALKLNINIVPMERGETIARLNLPLMKTQNARSLCL